MLDLVDLIDLLESSLLKRDLLTPKLDISFDYINSWVNNSGTSVICTINNDRICENFKHICLVPVENAVNIYVFYEINGVLTNYTMLLENLSDLDFS